MFLKKLIITGCGIKSLSHLTRENEAAIEQADFVLFLVNEPIMSQWIQKKSKKSESLEDLYFSEKQRVNAYKKITDRILLSINQYNNVCVAVYGHPLLLSNSITNLIWAIDKNKVSFSVLPAISVFDCLLTDLGIDPYMGCFSIEANALIGEHKYIDPTNHLIIWQIGIIADIYKILLLKEKLLRMYDLNHDCFLYEASIYPHIPPKIIKTKICNIEQEQISRLTTAYIPPIVK